MTLQIWTQQLADDAVTAAKIAALDAKLEYTTPHTLSADTDIVHKKYVDDIAAYGVSWKEPAKVLLMTTDASQSGTPPSGAVGDACVVNNWSNVQSFNDGVITGSTKNFNSVLATFNVNHVGQFIVIASGNNIGSHKITAYVDAHNVTLGDSTLVDESNVSFRQSIYEDGAVVEYSNGMWNTIVSSTAKAPPDGTRVMVSSKNLGGSFVGHSLEIGTCSSGTWTFAAADDGDAVLVNGNGSYYENRAYVYDSDVVPAWVQIAGMGLYNAGRGISIVGSTIEAVVDTTKGVELGRFTGIAVDLASGMYGYPGLKFNDHAMETGALMVKAGAGIEVMSDGVSIDTLGTPGIGVEKFSGIYNAAKQPVSAVRVYDAVATEPGSPTVGLTYLATAAGTWTGSVSVAAGDFMLYTANGWFVQIPGFGGYAAQGTRFLVAADAIDEFAAYQNYVMVVTTSDSNDPDDWSALPPQGGDGVIIKTSYGTGVEYLYNGPAVAWELSPALQSTSGLEISEANGGMKVLVTSDGGLQLDAAGVEVKIDGYSLVASGSGLKVQLAGTGGLKEVPNTGLAVDWKNEEKTNWNGSETDWVLATKAVIPPIISINGVMARKVNSGAGVNEFTYEQSTSTVAFGVAPTANSIVTAHYLNAGAI